jgi:hypothetical protein
MKPDYLFYLNDMKRSVRVEHAMFPELNDPRDRRIIYQQNIPYDMHEEDYVVKICMMPGNETVNHILILTPMVQS